MKLYVVRIYALPFRVLILLILLYGIYSCTGNHSASDSIPTFSGNIAELIYHKCTPCHRNGSAAPFNLITYEDLKRHARTIKLTVSSRVMPPWPADPSYSTFLDQKSLTNEELAMLITWLDNGCPIGDKMKIPPPPKFPEGSKFGKPDLVLTMTEPFPIKGDNRDRFMMLKIPYELPSDTFIRGIEIVPGNTKVVHHINGHLVEYNIGAKKDLTKGEKWIDTETMGKREAFQKLDLANDDGTYPLLIPSVTNYLPGVEPAIYPEGIGGYSLKKKGVLLLDNIHYGPWPHDTTDQTSFNFFFSPVPPKRPTREFILGTSGITPVEPPLVIPPDEIKTFVTHFTAPQDMSWLSVNPHMHLLGKKFLAFAVTPVGDTIRIIRINQWDFRWQYFYTFPTPLHIPSGSEITVEGTYDNTVNNPLNPFHPPQTVSEREGSMRTTDEMFQLIVTWLPYQPGDENISLETHPDK